MNEASMAVVLDPSLDSLEKQAILIPSNESVSPEELETLTVVEEEDLDNDQDDDDDDFDDEYDFDNDEDDDDTEDPPFVEGEEDE